VKRIIRGRVDMSLFGGRSCLGGGVWGGGGAAGRSSNVRCRRLIEPMYSNLLCSMLEEGLFSKYESASRSYHLQHRYSLISIRSAPVLGLCFSTPLLTSYVPCEAAFLICHYRF
jgi:hypothetical protein